MGTHQHHHLRLHHLLALIAFALRRGVLVRAAFVVLAGAWCVAASAAFPTVPLYKYSYGNVFGDPFSTKEAACADFGSKWPNQPVTTAVQDAFYCVLTETISGGSVGVGYSTVQGCPANSTLTNGQCACDASYLEQSGQCVPPPDECQKLAGASAGQKSWQRGSGEAPSGPTSTFMCGGDWSPAGAQKCVIKVDSDISYKDQGIWWATGTGYYTGATASSCNGDGGTGDSPLPSVPKQPDNPNPSPTPAAAAPAPCPAGQAPGEFNGTRICAPTGNDKPTNGPAPGNGSSEVKKPDGSSVTTNQSGETTCKQGTCTTTTTNNTVITNKPGDTSCPQGTTQGTTTKDGQTVTTCSSSSTATSTGSQAGFCKDNPSSKQCGSGQGGGFGGDCKAGFKAVSEDAVLNAMAEEQYRRNCEFFGKDEDPNSTVNKALSGQDGKNADKLKADAAGAPVDVGSFNTSGYGWGSSCPADPRIEIPWGSGTVLVIPFSRICAPMSLLSMAGVALTLLACMVWVVGPKQGGA